MVNAEGDEKVGPPLQGSSLARSRRSNFWTFPVDVFGSGPNTTVRGALKWAMLARQKAMMSAAATYPLSAFRLTKAQGCSPHVASGRATTAASITCGWR